MDNESNYQPQIIWRGVAIGLFDNPQPDMWYLEGPWIINESADAKEFQVLARNLNLQEVYHRLETGTEAFLHSERHEKPVRIIVMNLTEKNILSVRRMLTDEPKADRPKEVERPSLLRRIFNGLNK